MNVVTLPRDTGGAMEAVLVRPADDELRPGVVIIHEIYGLNKNIRQITARFAEQGYVALAVDLFSGRSRALCLMQIMYGMLLRPLKNGTLADLQGAIEHLRRIPGVDPTRIGVIGFCMGGAYALQLACVDDDLKAASVFYGLNPRPLGAVAGACPVVGSYPEKDPITAGHARRLEAAFKEHDVPHDLKIYAGAKHSFFNDLGPNHHLEAAKDAWRRMMMFFDKHLSGVSDEQ